MWKTEIRKSVLTIMRTLIAANLILVFISAFVLAAYGAD